MMLVPSGPAEWTSRAGVRHGAAMTAPGTRYIDGGDLNERVGSDQGTLPLESPSRQRSPNPLRHKQRGAPNGRSEKEGAHLPAGSSRKRRRAAAAAVATPKTRPQPVSRAERPRMA
jgi:hypothetical protein